MQRNNILILIGIGISLFTFLGVLIGLKIRNGNYFHLNRYNIQNISLAFIHPVEGGSSGCIEFRRQIQPDSTQDLGIELRMDLEFVSDSSERVAKEMGHRVKGFDGTKDSIVSLEILLLDSLERKVPSSQAEKFRDIGKPCYKEVVDGINAQNEPSGYVSDANATINELETFRKRLNTQDGVPRTEHGRVAFYLWPQPVLLRVLHQGGKAGILLTTKSGRQIMSWLPQLAPQ